MKIVVSKLLGDASVQIFNKQGELIHTEAFNGKFTGIDNAKYNRQIPVDPFEYGHSQALFDNKFEYKVVA